MCESSTDLYTRQLLKLLNNENKKRGKLLVSLNDVTNLIMTL